MYVLYIVTSGCGALVAGAAMSMPTCTSGCTSSSACQFNSISNVALGNATLSVDGQCHLIVGNIGSSGQDGVSQVSLPPSIHHVITTFEEPNFGTSSQPGDRENVTVYANVPGGIYYQLAVENIGNDTIQVRPDFSPVGATRYTVTVMNGNVVTNLLRDLPSAAFETGECVETEFN